MTPVGDRSIEQRAGLRHALTTLKSRDFRRWFVSQTLSASGASTQAVGQSWLIVELGGGGVALGLVNGAIFLPTLLLGAPSGALADRYDRRRLLILTQCLQITISLSLAALTVAGLAHLWVLGLFALAMGTVFAIDAPARQVYVLELVGTDRVASAISLNEVMLNASRILGPAVGGVILAFGHVWLCFFANGLFFVPMLLTLVFVSASTRRRALPPIPSHPGQLRDGMQFARRTAGIRATLLMAVCSAAVINVGVIMPLMASRVFHSGGASFGAMLACFGIGAVPGAVLSAAGGPEPKGSNVRALAVAMGLAVIACALAPSLPLLFVTLGIVGATSIWFIARANAYVLLSTPPGLRGRVMGMWSVALPGTNPVSGLAMGITAAHAGPRVAYLAVGVATFIVASASYRALKTSERQSSPGSAPLDLCIEQA